MKMSFCPNCQKATMHTENSTSHVGHIIGTLLTGGIWLVVWGICYFSNAKKADVCCECGCKN